MKSEILPFKILIVNSQITWIIQAEFKIECDFKKKKKKWKSIDFNIIFTALIKLEYTISYQIKNFNLQILNQNN